MHYGQLLDRLSELVNEEHVSGCDCNSCDINAAYNNGFELWAIYLFDSCGAASDEFERLYKKLPKRRFNADAEREREKLVKTVEHAECANCNAVVWEYVEHCDSCGNFQPLNAGVSNE
jgi:hypothetical protein